MPPVTLKGDTLGKKRQHFNKLIEDAIANKHYELCNISGYDSDIDNLLKIEIASKTRNVDYIIEVMKSKDMLYAATAIKRATWLITEQQYANIINPEYLHTQLLPSMNTKTFNKLMLHIRLNLKDESRVETFYEYLKQTDSSYKWLENCSIPFIENVIKNERLIPLSLFKRLCRRSACFMSYYTRVDSRNMKKMKHEILFLLKSHTADVLTVLEDEEYDQFPELGKKKTEILMKACPQRIFDNFDKYARTIDLSVIAKYLNKRKINTFLYKHARRLCPRLYEHDTLRHFIKHMPQQDRFKFVKKTFIDKSDMKLLFSDEETRIVESNVKLYQWYEFAPFDVAFQEIKKLIHKEISLSERCAMLSVLITCARRNPQHIKTLRMFVNDKHINEPLKFQIQFLNDLLTQIPTHEFNIEIWNVLDQLFHSMEVYTESENDVQLCLKSITLHKILNDKSVPEIVEQKMTFNSFKKTQRKLNPEQNIKMFTYLLNSVLTKVETDIANESDFRETVVNLKNVLSLLKDWNKDISKYPYVLKKIQKLIMIKQENMWKTDIYWLYNMKKSWRKHMFEESLSLCLCEATCLNALKHKPQLLTRHDKEIDTLRTNDAVSLRRLLTKLRIYWPHSLAQQWTEAYLLNLNKPTGQKAAIKGLFLLLPQNQIIDMAGKHAPDNFETDQTEISIRKYIAQHLHLARPLIPLDTVLLYSNEDYLEHAVPSLNAILYNMSEIESREHLPKLLAAPVSLRKFGLHLVYFKLKSDEMKSIYSEIWNTTENISIRAILFKHTYMRMCKVKNPTVEKELWELLSTFMDYIFSGRLGHVENVPSSIRVEYYMKSYKFMTALRNRTDLVDDVIEYAPKIMDLLDSDFVEEKMLSPAVFKFCLYKSKFIEIFACYVLCGKSQDDQLERFRKVVEPAMGEAFQMWESVHLDCYFIQDNFKKFIQLLVWNFRIYLSLHKIPIPVKLFLDIKAKMEKELPMLQNYVLITSFKLLTEYLKIMDEDGSAVIVCEHFKFSESDVTNGQMSRVMEILWKYFHLKSSPFFGPKIVECLKEDTAQYGPKIHDLFAEAFEKMFQILIYNDILYFRYVGSMLETLKYMLDDNDFIPSYLVVSKVLPKQCNDYELKLIQSEIRRKLRSHPSTIVQVQYFNDFRDVPEDAPPVSEGLSKLLCYKMSCQLI